MHIPPYYKKKEWKRFLAGIVLGAGIGYLFFVFVHGELQEMYVEENIQLTSELHSLEDKYEVLLNSDKQEEKKSSTVQKVVVTYTNAKELQLDKLTQHQLTSMVKKQLQSIQGKEVSVVGDQTEMMITAIQNKRYVIDDFTYRLVIKQLVVTEEVSFQIKVDLEH